MIKLENIESNVVRVTVPEKLKADDFQLIAPQADALIKQHGKIRLLIDASQFNGWENVAAFERHISFVKTHHEKVERAALIAGHMWQHWVVGMAKLFVHPEIRVYDEAQASEARQWVSGK